MHEDRFISTAELAHAAGVLTTDIDYWVSVRLLVPAREASGPGTRRGFTVEHIIEGTQLGDLTKAGLNTQQTRRIVNVQRATLAGLPADERLVRRFELYIGVVTTLSEIFGRGPGYDAWRERQEQQLAKMRAELTPLASRRGRPRRHDLRLLRMFLEANDAKPATHAAAIATA